MAYSDLACFVLFALLLQVYPSAYAQAIYEWTEYRQLEYAIPRQPRYTHVTYAPPYTSLSSLVSDRATTTWPSNPSPTDGNEKYGNVAWSSQWETIPVSSPPFTTTVSPSPIPSEDLIKPPPLLLATDQNSSHRFPKDFQWGFAGAALQIEGALKNGGRGPSMWEASSRGNYSSRVGGGPPDISALNYYLYKQDIARLAAIGVQSYSFSISWPRIMPFGVAGSPINQKAIDHYDDVINTVLSYNMTPVVTLHHFDTPVYFQSNTSFLKFDDPMFVDSFVYYAQSVLAHYADRVGTWYTFNEPTMDVNIFGNRLPSRNVLMAHAKVVHWYRDVIKGTAKWSMKFDLSDTGFALPRDPSNKSDVAAAIRRNEFNVGYYAHPLFKGEPVPESLNETLGSKVPSYTPEELDFINGTADFFAFDIYTSTYHSAPDEGIEACAKNQSHPEWPACTLQFNTRKTWPANFYGNVDRVALPSEHIRTILGYWAATYPTEGGITIAEFGLPPFQASDMSLQHQASDLAQSNFFVPILNEVLKAINLDGVHVKGVFGWSFIDNWEWGQYDDRYGVQAYNQTTLERTYKRAIFDYAHFILDH